MKGDRNKSDFEFISVWEKVVVWVLCRNNNDKHDSQSRNHDKTDKMDFLLTSLLNTEQHKIENDNVDKQLSNQARYTKVFYLVF